MLTLSHEGRLVASVTGTVQNAYARRFQPAAPVSVIKFVPTASLSDTESKSRDTNSSPPMSQQPIDPECCHLGFSNDKKSIRVPERVSLADLKAALCGHPVLVTGLMYIVGHYSCWCEHHRFQPPSEWVSLAQALQLLPCVTRVSVIPGHAVFYAQETTRHTHRLCTDNTNVIDLVRMDASTVRCGALPSGERAHFVDLVVSHEEDDSDSESQIGTLTMRTEADTMHALSIYSGVHHTTILRSAIFAINVPVRESFAYRELYALQACTAAVVSYLEVTELNAWRHELTEHNLRHLRDMILHKVGQARSYASTLLDTLSRASRYCLRHELATVCCLWLLSKPINDRAPFTLSPHTLLLRLPRERDEHQETGLRNLLRMWLQGVRTGERRLIVQLHRPSSEAKLETTGAGMLLQVLTEEDKDGDAAWWATFKGKLHVVLSVYSEAELEYFSSAAYANRITSLPARYQVYTAVDRFGTHPLTTLTVSPMLDQGGAP